MRLTLVPSKQCLLDCLNAVLDRLTRELAQRISCPFLTGYALRCSTDEAALLLGNSKGVFDPDG